MKANIFNKKSITQDKEIIIIRKRKIGERIYCKETLQKSGRESLQDNKYCKSLEVELGKVSRKYLI